MAAIVDLFGKRGLVVGITNDSSIAAGCAGAFRPPANLAVTYLNDKAAPFLPPAADALGASLCLPGVRIEGQLKAVFDTMAPMPCLPGRSPPGQRRVSSGSTSLSTRCGSTPPRRLVSIAEVGRIAAFLASEAATPLSGSVV